MHTNENSSSRFEGFFGLFRVYLSFVKGKFLQLDDTVVNGLLERQKNEQANVALVGALLMTITFSFIPGERRREDLKGEGVVMV